MELQLAMRDNALECAATVNDDADPDGIGELLPQFRFENAVERHETVHDLRGIEIGEEFLQRFLAETAHDDALLRLLLRAALLRLRHLQQLDEPLLARTVDELLERAARLQQAELENRTATLTALLEPVLLLAMGGFVLLIVMAVMQPIIEINTLMK